MRYPSRPGADECPERQDRKDLYLSTYEDDEDMDDFFNAPPSVTALDISDNENIGNQGFTALCRSLSEFAPFASLGAENIGLSGQGVGALQELRQGSLEYLALSRNELGDKGVEALCTAIAKHIP